MFVEADNGQVSIYNHDLPFTDDFGICRRLALIMLERNRQQLSVQASFGMKAFQVQVGDIIQLSVSRMGWTNKEFEVVHWAFGLSNEKDLQVTLSLREISSNVFDDIADGLIYERDNTTLLSPFEVPTVSLHLLTNMVVSLRWLVKSYFVNCSLMLLRLMQVRRLNYALTKLGQWKMQPSPSLINYRFTCVVNKLPIMVTTFPWVSVSTVGYATMRIQRFL